MIEKISLRIFWGFMLLCAGTMLSNIWLFEEPPEFQMKLVATFFIIGFASFLVWAPHIVYRFYFAIEK